MREEWREINGYDGYYQVSNMGRVRSVDRTFTRTDGMRARYKGMILRTSHDKKKYPHVRISILKKRKKTIKIHRLVAKHFIPNPKGFIQVNHIDGNKDNNQVSNLEWCDNTHNMRHGTELGLHAKRFNKYEIRLIRQAHAESEATGLDRFDRPFSYKKLGIYFSCSEATIRKIVSREIWAHVR